MKRAHFRASWPARIQAHRSGSSGPMSRQNCLLDVLPKRSSRPLKSPRHFRLRRCHRPKDSDRAAQASILDPAAAAISAPVNEPAQPGSQVELDEPFKRSWNAEPIPARMLNEFVYGPRLFYYEYVEGGFRGITQTRRVARRCTRALTKAPARYPRFRPRGQTCHRSSLRATRRARLRRLAPNQ